MTAREDNPWVEVAVKVPCEMEGSVRAVLSSLVPSMMWQNEKKKSGCKVFLALGELSCVRGPFCLVMANLVPTLHVKVYETLWQAVAPGGWLILSGFCQTHKDSILRPYIHNGATEKACSFDHAWAGTLLHKLK